ncbi:hypothetical protein MVEN_02118500 [Mycena venus]|uniref:Uncharacterized protein n=1 Tax=Mycena venus TaxID=2733690 RepID=A0A8H6XA73_9AGAR|nr:hypothetical protein MVEN_02118500 [Mycena venus]
MFPTAALISLVLIVAAAPGLCAPVPVFAHPSRHNPRLVIGGSVSNIATPTDSVVPAPTVEAGLPIDIPSITVGASAASSQASITVSESPFEECFDPNSPGFLNCIPVALPVPPSDSLSETAATSTVTDTPVQASATESPFDECTDPRTALNCIPVALPVSPSDSLSEAAATSTVTDTPAQASATTTESPFDECTDPRTALNCIPVALPIDM